MILYLFGASDDFDDFDDVKDLDYLDYLSDDVDYPSVRCVCMYS